MATYKVAATSSLIFQLGLDYHDRGDYTVEAKDINSVTCLKISQKFTRAVLLDWTKYTDFRDSTNTAYGTYALCAADVATILAKDSVSNSLATSKSQITQITSKTTAVAAETASTTITTFALTDVADGTFTFTFTNSLISATSILLCSVNMNGGNGKAIINPVAGAGSASIVVTNVGTASFSSAIKINVVII